MSLPTLSVVVLSWNTRELTLACLAALERDRAASRRPHELILVDNASEDGTAEAVAAHFPAVVLVRNPTNLLYAEGNDVGARRASGTWLCLLNSDTEVRPGALDLLVDFLEAHPDHAAAGPKLLNPDGSTQRACTRFPGLLSALVDSTLLGRFPPGSWLAAHVRMRDFDHERSRDVPQPPGACLLMRRSEFLALGGLDPALSLYFNDVDLCRRIARSGRRVRYLAEAEVVHHGGASTRKLEEQNALWFRNRAAYYAKHYGALGAAWHALVLRLWGAQVALGIALGPRSWSEKVRAWRELGRHLARCRPGAGESALALRLPTLPD